MYPPADKLRMSTCPLEIALWIVALHALHRRDPVDLGEFAGELLREHRPVARA